ncbi:TMEM175 family protein [Henriciella sp. AS95]|uniref:TMEM175 family protein n=1 Tax=Henriciella sp. AS95 TaxID=3135782 RepID=UPI0031700545
MIRETAMRELDHDPRFEWRGGSVTRIENLSDIVFALALGMIVSSASRPETFTQLTDHLFTILPVGAAFVLLFMIWNHHYVFFRRYGVADGKIIVLNCILLLLVLFIAYPLRFIFDGLYGFVEGLMGDWSRLEAAGITYSIAGTIMGYFALGYGLIYLIISQMYAHALKKADQLGLTPSERAMTRQSIWVFRVQIIAVTITGLCATFTPMYAFSGWLMILIWPGALLVDRLVPIPEVED